MNNKDFDNLLREKFDSEPLSTKAGSWDNLSQRLPDVKKKRRFLYIKIAASFIGLLSLLGGLTYLFSNSNLFSNHSIEIAQKTTENSSNLSKVDKASVALAEKTITDKSNSPEIKKKTVKEVTIPVGHGSSITANTHTSGKSGSTRQNGNKVPLAFSKGVNIPEKSQTKPFSENIIPGHSSEIRNEDITLQNHFSGNSSNPKAFSSFPKKGDGFSNNQSGNLKPITSPINSIAIGTGMNYGALNAGYTLGVSARHAIGKHTFIEGAISFLYNNQVSDVVAYGNYSSFAGRPASGQAASNVVMPVSNFSYLNVNPTVGYEVTNFIDFSLGPDVQQRVSNMGDNTSTIFTPGNNPRIIPELDFGITGKTDFQITPNIEAGLLFRNGLNNLLKRSDVYPYLNRRYIQVELKYNFLFHNK